VLDILAQGGAWVYTSTPSTVCTELAPHGLRQLDVVPGPFPSARLRVATPWYEYVFQKESAETTVAP
jgi:hypothetical protein